MKFWNGAIVLIFINVIFSTATVRAQDDDLSLLINNLKKVYLKEDDIQLNTISNEVLIDKSAGDQMIQELYQKRNLTTQEVEQLMNNFTVEGTWTDLNYNDVQVSGWELKIHAERILILTKEYKSPNSSYYGNKDVRSIIHKGLQYWFLKKPVNSNWWYNRIGIPKTLGPVFILIEDELNEYERKEAIRVMSVSKFGETGQNKVWLAGNVFYKALLTKDINLAKQARDIIVSEIVISEGEGIKSDFSFHQHGPQQQFGNYGLAFITGMASWARIFAETTFAVPETKLEIVRNLFKNAYNLLSWKGNFDVNSLGRQFYKNVQRDKAIALCFVANDLMQVDKNHKTLYKDFISRNFNRSNHQSLVGIKNYYNSDMTVYRSKDWFSSVKMSSERVIGAEALNGENLQGYYLADGATYITMRGNEYLNIFPVWNWRNLPGVTCYESKNPLKTLTLSGYRNKNAFAGGINDGINGVSAFVLNRDSLVAKKSYFFIDQQLVCLGSGITSFENNPVTTTLNQCFLKDEVYYFTDKVNQLSKETILQHEKMKWIFHDNIAYFPLENTKLEVSNQTHTGSWHNIMKKYEDDTVSAKIFTIKVKPEVKPQNATYAYVIAPKLNLNELKSYKLKTLILRNDELAQVVASADSRLFMMAIFSPVKINIPQLGEVYFEQPGLYMLNAVKQKWQLTIADPTQKLSKMALQLQNKKYTIDLPNGLDKGKQVQQILD